MARNVVLEGFSVYVVGGHTDRPRSEVGVVQNSPLAFLEPGVVWSTGPPSLPLFPSYAESSEGVQRDLPMPMASEAERTPR